MRQSLQQQGRQLILFRMNTSLIKLFFSINDTNAGIPLFRADIRAANARHEEFAVQLLELDFEHICAVIGFSNVIFVKV